MAQQMDMYFRDFVTNALGFNLIEVPQNGDSMFAAVSLGIYNDITQGQFVRTHSHYHIVTHWSEFADTFAAQGVQEAAVAGLLVNGVPVSRVFLYGVSHAFGVNIVLWNYNGSITKFAPQFETTINLTRHPGGHYNFMHRNEQQQANPAAAEDELVDMLNAEPFFAEDGQ